MVLGRIASNFVPAERERRAPAKNENTPPSSKARGIRAAFSQKIASSLSSISAASRRRRARLHGGLEKERHRVADSARKHDRTQSRSRTHTPPVSVNTRSAPTMSPQTSPGMAESEERLETEDCEMGEAPPMEGSTPAFRGVTLPRRLLRPAYREVNSVALAAIDPGLTETNVEYMRDCLEANGVSMLNVLARTSVLSTSTKPISPNGGPGIGQSRNASILPYEATVRVSDTSADLPTHMLAIYSSHTAALNSAAVLNGASSDTVKTRVQLLPAHAIVLAAHCANVPALPGSEPAKQLMSEENCKENGQVVLTLPVVPLSIPSPATFPLLAAYLYTQDSDNLLRALLGVSLSPAPLPTLAPASPPAIILTPPIQLPTPAPSPELTSSELAPLSTATTENGAALTALTTELSIRVQYTSFALAALHTGDGDTLIKKVGLVMGLWKNACALGVFDSGLWSTLDAAWAVLLGAMAICQRKGHGKTA